MHSTKATNENTMINTISNTKNERQPLRHYVEETLNHYFEYLGNETPANLYHFVLTEVEVPLLKSVLKYTDGNQSKAAQILGMNRGTLRKKLKEYNLDTI
ncbi:MAG: DNA-binding protein Fis [Legionellaceae bacterium]